MTAPDASGWSELAGRGFHPLESAAFARRTSIAGKAVRKFRGGDFAGLMQLFAQLQEKAKLRTGQSFRVIVVQEAGLDGFWLHRALQNEGIESHVVDPASIATSRRRRRAKTDKIDGETLVRTLLAYKRGEPRVCAMLKVPTPGGKTAATSAASAKR